MTNLKYAKTERQKKIDRREKFILKGKNKKKSSIRIDGILKPLRERCITRGCRTKVKHHHFYCDKCHYKRNKLTTNQLN